VPEADLPKAGDPAGIEARCRAAAVGASVFWRSESTLPGRMTQETAAILRCIHRIEMIRETSFLPLVYGLA